MYQNYIIPYLYETSEMNVNYSEGFLCIWIGNLIIYLHIQEVAKATTSLNVCHCRH
jgi:hypothetical protein